MKACLTDCASTIHESDVNFTPILSRKLMDAVVEATGKGVITVIGGGDTATACKKYGTEEKACQTFWGGSSG